jgi:hypothetical protein
MLVRPLAALLNQSDLALDRFQRLVGYGEYTGLSLSGQGTAALPLERKQPGAQGRTSSAP